MNICMTGLTPFLVEEKGVHVLQLFPNRKLNKFLISRMKFIYQKEKNNRIKIMQVYIVMS